MERGILWVEERVQGPHSWKKVIIGPSSSSKSQALENYQVLLGNTQLYQQTKHTQKTSVSQIITHPDFEKYHPFGSDIAMLQLHPPVNFSSYVIPACLPPPDMQLPNHTSCWITGWGMLTEDSEGDSGGALVCYHPST